MQSVVHASTLRLAFVLTSSCVQATRKAFQIHRALVPFEPSRWVLQTTGFISSELNRRWYERRDVRFSCDGATTYWTRDATLFLYWWSSRLVWAIANASHFSDSSAQFSPLAFGPRVDAHVPGNPTMLGGPWTAVVAGGWSKIVGSGISAASQTCTTYHDSTTCESISGCRWMNWSKEANGYCMLDYVVEATADQKYITDVTQGTLADCYLMASLSILYHTFPDAIREMLAESRAHSSIRGVTVHRIALFIAGKRILVAVDEAIPVNMAGFPVFAGYEPQNRLRIPRGIWPILVEKAWAKLHGNYKSIEYAYASEALRAITGCPVETIDHRVLDKDQVSRRLRRAMQSRHLIAATSKDTAVLVQPQHVYQVADVSVGSDYVTLYNPIGVGKNAGLQDITLQEYFSNFVLTDTVRIRRSYTPTLLRAFLHEGQLDASYEMVVGSQSGTFTVTLEWPSREFLGCPFPDPPIIIEVISPSGSRSKKSGTFWSSSVSLEGLKVEAGAFALHVNVDFGKASWMPYVGIIAYAAGPVEITQRRNVQVAGVFAPASHYNGLYRWNSRYTVHYGFQVLESIEGNYMYNCQRSGAWVITGPGLAQLGNVSSACNGVAYLPSSGSDCDWLVWDSTSDTWSPSSGCSRLVDAPRAASGVASDPCALRLVQLDKLDNADSILSTGYDPEFPPSLGSIGTHDSTCGDHNVDAPISCETFNRWRTLHDIMGDEDPTYLTDPDSN